jgi:hypothetical protein
MREDVGRTTFRRASVGPPIPREDPSALLSLSFSFFSGSAAKASQARWAAVSSSLSRQAPKWGGAKAASSPRFAAFLPPVKLLGGVTGGWQAAAARLTFAFLPFFSFAFFRGLWSRLEPAAVCRGLCGCAPLVHVAAKAEAFSTAVAGRGGLRVRGGAGPRTPGYSKVAGRSATKASRM